MLIWCILWWLGLHMRQMMVHPGSSSSDVLFHMFYFELISLFFPFTYLLMFIIISLFRFLLTIFQLGDRRWINVEKHWSNTWTLHWCRFKVGAMLYAHWLLICYFTVCYVACTFFTFFLFFFLWLLISSCILHLTWCFVCDRIAFVYLLFCIVGEGP